MQIFCVIYIYNLYFYQQYAHNNFINPVYIFEETQHDDCYKKIPNRCRDSCGDCHECRGNPQ
ncbi:hypothetical protein ENHYDAX1_160019 [Enhydrobacter sp. AX1]|nr:hypothetical protein ENHYDAX1_160019 [Enhydrobacter sp. AX1]